MTEPVKSDDTMTEFEAELHQITLDAMLRIISKGVTMNEAMRFMSGKPLGYDPSDLNIFANRIKQLGMDELKNEAESFTYEGNTYPLSELAEHKAALIAAQIRIRKRRELT